MRNNIAVIRSGGDIGTAIAHKLHRCGFRVLILETAHPLVIRRTVAFAQAIFDGEAEVEGVKAVGVEKWQDIYGAWKNKNIPIMIDEDCSILQEMPVDILVDAIIAKINLGTRKDMAPITIAVGPGFDAGKDVDVVVETNRGHDLGKLIFSGFAEDNTGLPGKIMGYDKERVIHASCSGEINIICDIGQQVRKGQVIASIDGEIIKATIDGVIRGMIHEDTLVRKGLKIADIDPRGEIAYCYTMSDKARAIAGAVLEAILYLKNKKDIVL